MADFISSLFSKDLVANISLHKLSERFNRAELFGKKLNVVGEIKAKKLTEISTFKSVTGSDNIMGEFKGQNPFYFAPRCKLLFAGNALPGTTEADATKAFTNRLVVLLFNCSISKKQQNKNLPADLWAERDSIFTLAMVALRELHCRGYLFTTPEESASFIQAFGERENSVLSFVHNCCTIVPGARTFNVELLAGYTAYRKINGLVELSRTRFYELLDAIPEIRPARMRINGENRQGRCGIQLKEAQYPIGGTLEQDCETP